MDPATNATSGPVHFLNLEYFFRLLYNLVEHGIGPGTNYGLFFSELWALYTGVAYVVAFLALGVLVYSTVRLYQTAEEEAPRYTTIEVKAAEAATEHARWAHVASLVESTSESDWRQAIIEADIMLDDVLASHGYVGNTVGEKLKQGDPAHFHSLRDAWEAHLVRNQIAHEGSAYQLSGQMAYRTIAKYKNVFEEFHAI